MWVFSQDTHCGYPGMCYDVFATEDTEMNDRLLSLAIACVGAFIIACII